MFGSRAPLPFSLMDILPNFIGPSRPTDALLFTSAPPVAWYHAKKQADRSPMIRFKAGCALFNPSTGEVVAKGCSHPDIKFSKAAASVHAERHAISRCSKRASSGLWAVVITFNGRGGCAYSSRPCYGCASSLYRADVERVVYPERLGNGAWVVQSEHPEELLARAAPPEGLYAREQRIPALA
jgi:tRNA(Arg) A34 adenosine deaminase TadA